jgi:hypothetical protein
MKYIPFFDSMVSVYEFDKANVNSTSPIEDLIAGRG